MSAKVRMTVALAVEAAARLDEVTSERKRGEYLSQLILQGALRQAQRAGLDGKVEEVAAVLRQAQQAVQQLADRLEGKQDACA